jgi:hypothetical protein
MRYPAFDGTQQCASIGTSLFYPDNPSNVTVMEKQIIHQTCYSCRIQSQCLEWGLRHEEYGYWGGLSPNQRRELRRKVGIRLEVVPVTAYVGLQNVKQAS